MVPRWPTKAYCRTSKRRSTPEYRGVLEVPARSVAGCYATTSRVSASCSAYRCDTTERRRFVRRFAAFLESVRRKFILMERRQTAILNGQSRIFQTAPNRLSVEHDFRAFGYPQPLTARLHPRKPTLCEFDFCEGWASLLSLTTSPPSATSYALNPSVSAPNRISRR